MPMIYFVAGILFWALLMPFLDKLFETFISYLQLKISEIAVKVSRCQVQINEAAEEKGVRVVGFNYECNSEADNEVDDG